MRKARSSTGPKTRRSTARTEKLTVGHLNRHLGYFLRRLQLWVFQDFIRTLAPLKVRPAQYSVLLIVEANPGRSQAAIGKTLGIERARLARMLHALEHRKWIARHANGSDARSHSLYLTAQGEKALVRIKRLAEQHEAKLAELVGPGRHKQLMAWLREYA
ncbi:MAG: MarR family winged helix-turn-helix transcriptional regulator [Pseudolabrys sp.]